MPQPGIDSYLVVKTDFYIGKIRHYRGDTLILIEELEYSTRFKNQRYGNIVFSYFRSQLNKLTTR